MQLTSGRGDSRTVSVTSAWRGLGHVAGVLRLCRCFARILRLLRRLVVACQGRLRRRSFVAISPLTRHHQPHRQPGSRQCTGLANGLVGVTGLLRLVLVPGTLVGGGGLSGGFRFDHCFSTATEPLNLVSLAPPVAERTSPHPGPRRTSQTKPATRTPLWPGSGKSGPSSHTTSTQAPTRPPGSGLNLPPILSPHRVEDAVAVNPPVRMRAEEVAQPLDQRG